MAKDYDGTITIGAKLEIVKGSIQQQSRKLMKTVLDSLRMERSVADAEPFSKLTDSIKQSTDAISELNKSMKSVEPERDLKLEGLYLNLAKAENQMETLRGKIAELSNERALTPIASDYVSYITKTTQEIDKLKAKQIELANSTNNSAQATRNKQAKIEALQAKIDQLTESVAKYQNELKQLDLIDEKYRTVNNTEKLDALMLRYEGASLAVEKYKQQISAIESVNSTKSTEQGFKDLERSIFNTTKQTTNLLSELNKTSKEGSFSVAKMNKSLKKGALFLIKYGLGIRSVFFLWRRVRSAIGDATKEMAKQIPEVNTTLSSLSTSLNQVKASLGTAFQPILSAVQPILISFMSTLNNVIVTLAKFFSAMRGQTYIYKATAAQTNYAKSLEKSNKAQKKQLAGFDELNNISSDSGGGGGASSTPTADYDKEPIDPKFLTMVEKVKKVLEAILPLVTLIGLAFGAWKLINFINDLLGLHLSLKTMVGIMLLIVGLILTAYEYSKMWTEGITWDRMAKYFVGIATVLTGLALIFGKVGVAVGLLVAGFMTLILAIKDILENGVNAQNSFTALAGIIMIVVGAFLLFGSTVAIIVGIIAGLIVIFAALISWAGNGKEAINLLKNAFGEFGKAIKALVNGDLDQAWAHAKKGIYNLANFFISCAEGIANGFIKMANVVIDAVNNMLPETIPDWVPIIGGNSFPKIPEISKSVSLGRMKIPALAQGAVLPPNDPFLAIVGDQKSGTNIEAPISTIKEALAEVLSDKMISLLVQQVNLLEDIADKDIIISENDLFKTIRNKSRIYKKSTGVNAFEF